MNRIINKYGFWILLVVSCLTLLPFLGETLFYSKGEPREAVVAVSMLHSFNWILPVSSGDMIPYKPPFMAWCIALFSLPVGHVNEYVSRLPSALALIGVVMWTFNFLKNYESRMRAFMTAMVMLTSFEVFRAGFACRVDMLLTFFIIGSIYSLIEHWVWDFKKIPWTSIALMTCGFLTKGPVAVVIPCVVVWAFMMMCQESFWKVTGRFVLWALMASVIPALWYWGAYCQGGQRFLDLVIEENFGRMTGSMSYESHVNPWWYNLVTLITGFLPYTLMLLMSLAVVFKNVRLHRPKYSLRYYIFQLDVAELLSLTGAIVVFVFYCIPSSKRSVYLLPMYPFVSYFIARYILYLAKHFKCVVKTYCGILCVIAVIVFAVFVVIQCGQFPSSLLKGKHDLGMYVSGLSSYIPIYKWLLALIPVMIALYLLVKLRRLSGYGGLFGALALTVTLYWVFAGLYQPAVLNTKSDRQIARDIDMSIMPYWPVYYYTKDYATRFYGVNFYLEDRMKPIEKAYPWEIGYLLVAVKDWEDYLSKNGDRYEFKQLRHYYTRSCDLRDETLFFQFVPKSIGFPKNTEDLDPELYYLKNKGRR